MEEEAIEVIDTLVEKDTESGTKYYSWEHKGQSIAASARREKPYVHYCPIDHFSVIFKSIGEALQNNSLISVATIFSDLENIGLAPGRPFKGRAEDYKIRMILGILEVEGLLKWTGSKSPIEYVTNKTPEDFSNWYKSNIDVVMIISFLDMIPQLKII